MFCLLKAKCICICLIERYLCTSVTLPMAMSKRNYIIEKLEEDFRNVFMTYADLSSLLPSPTVAYPKRLWEKKMYRARATCRGVHICEETGHRSNLRNFILKEYEAI